MNKALIKNISYDPLRDFVPLGFTSAYPFVLLARPDLPVSNLAELVKYAKERPGSLTYGSAESGPCSTSGERFSSRARAWMRCTCRSKAPRRPTRR